MSEIIQLKKRGRKPKNKLIENKIQDSPVNSDKEAIHNFSAKAAFKCNNWSVEVKLCFFSKRVPSLNRSNIIFNLS